MKKSSPIFAAGWISMPVTARLSVGEHPRGERHAGLVQRVGEAVGEDRLHPAPAGEDLEVETAVRRRIAVARRGDVGAHLRRTTLPAHLAHRSSEEGRDM